VLAMSNEIALLQYPPAAASAVVLVIIVMVMVAAILRLVDVQKELSGQGGATVMQQQSVGTRPWTFYVLAAGFTLFVVFLYGPMFAIYLLSFQGPNGGLTFPMHGVSLHWFTALFAQQRTGDVAGAFLRSLALALLVLVLTVVMAMMAGLAFRRRFVGAALVFYLAIASLVMPGLLVGLGIGLMCQLMGLQPAWYASALGAQLTWTLPFGLLIMFAVFSRFNGSYEEAARDLGASSWQTLRHVVLPILLPGIIGVALFGFTLSYDEFARTLLTVGPHNTLPLEIWAMTTNVTSPSLYALGTLTTAVSFVAITLALSSMALIQRRRARQSLHAQAGE
jgi:putative spermidine/putrescine transport system permease protein